MSMEEYGWAMMVTHFFPAIVSAFMIHLGIDLCMNLTPARRVSDVVLSTGVFAAGLISWTLFCLWMWP